MKKLLICLITGLIFAVTLSVSGFSAGCSTICDDVLRLHIPANSDSEEDQQLKIKVRDAILSETSDLFSASQSKQQSVQIAADNLDVIEQTANRVIKENGFDYTAKAELVNMYFSTRKYDSITMPAGKYDAVRVTLGKGEGHNWWCVMFPQLCIPAVSDEDCMDIFTDEQKEILENGDKYEMSFLIVEWMEKLKAANQQLR